jgi:hypothetical protein
MTRDYNNQRREDPQSDSRGSSSRRFEEERPSRPARPRLNRDMVDRAWENGARQNHADYRTRSDSNTHSTRDNRRPNQHTNRYSTQTSSNSRKPYGNRQDNYRPGERSPRSYNGPRPRNFESSMRTFDDQHYNQYERRGYSKQPYQDDYRSGNSRNAQRPHPRTQYQGRDQYRGPQRREFDRDTSSPRNFDRDQRQDRAYDRDTRQPRSYDRDKRSSRNASGPDTHNPRWQSRPKGDRIIFQIGLLNIRVMGQNRSYSKAITSILTRATLLNLTHIKPKLIRMLRSDQVNATPLTYPMAGF